MGLPQLAAAVSNAGGLGEEEFKRAMTEMANDLSGFTNKNEATEKPGKPNKTT